MQLSSTITLLIACLVQMANANWWGDLTDDLFDDGRSSLRGFGGHFGRFMGRRQFSRTRSLFNRWRRDDDDDDDDDDWRRRFIGRRRITRQRQIFTPRRQFMPTRRLSQTWNPTRRTNSFNNFNTFNQIRNSRPNRFASQWGSPSMTNLWMMRDFDTPDLFDFTK